MNGDAVAMATEAMDVEGVLDSADDSAWAGIPAATVIGHVHLHVSDLTRSEQFYSGLLGLDVMQRGYPGALFMAAGGYHHHLGVNTWAGRTPPPANAVGLESFTVDHPRPAGMGASGRTHRRHRDRRQRHRPRPRRNSGRAGAELTV